MTRVTQGARQRHFILWLGFRVDVVNLKHSVRYESLVVSNSRNQTSPKPIIYVDIWIYDCWSTVNLITVHEPLVSLASPRFRALPPTTVIIIIQSNRYCSHIKPRLILYSNESCHTSRADTICAVSL